MTDVIAYTSCSYPFTLNFVLYNLTCASLNSKANDSCNVSVCPAKNSDAYKWKYCGPSNKSQLSKPFKTSTFYCQSLDDAFNTSKTAPTGWFLIQERDSHKSFDFNRTWDEYKRGFGQLGSNFWIGNVILNKILSNSCTMLFNSSSYLTTTNAAETISTTTPSVGTKISTTTTLAAFLPNSENWTTTSSVLTVETVTKPPIIVRWRLKIQLMSNEFRWYSLEYGNFYVDSEVNFYSLSLSKYDSVVSDLKDAFQNTSNWIFSTFDKPAWSCPGYSMMNGWWVDDHSTVNSNSCANISQQININSNMMSSIKFYDLKNNLVSPMVTRMYILPVMGPR
ncbi:hypothetical protein HELRODRAFT_162808 [Helobdella robusta]|uniref:Fibrinogen C-terminal domain-containing protein n=1 Tax=Helobdella robusta TaxID=6412 RepID=T1ET70_HELRO|nr:hypothetical protein HELRODRAFT_162808 [Helobdella robusta]ESN99290.1 hypothetical protein HELRODRAFT_162808 [Helobdella robusta]